MVYAPGTNEQDQKKQNRALQDHAGKIAANTSGIATNTTSIASNTTAITGVQTKTTGYEAAWNTYTPTITATSGTFTSVAATGSFLTIGKLVHFTVTIIITTVGTASSAIICPLPVTTAKRAAIIPVAETAVVGTMGVGRIAASASNMLIVRYDAGTLIGAGNNITCTGIYELA